MAFASRFCDSVGDGSGSIQLNVDGSVTPQIFRIAPFGNEILRVSRLIWTLEDSGSIDSGGFGNGSALSNGVVFRFVYDVGPGNEDGTVYPQPTYRPITTNGQWHEYCGPDVVVSSWGSGNQYLSCRYSFFKDVNNDGDSLPWLSNARGEELQVIIQDDLTGIVGITCRFGMFTN